MFRTSARIATAALLALTITACSSDDDKDDAAEHAETRTVPDGTEIRGTVDEPESASGCETSLKIRWTASGERDLLTYGAAVGSADGKALTLYASDDKLNLDALPDSPRVDDDDLMVIEIAPVQAKKADPLALGQQIDNVDDDSAFTAELQLLTDDDATGDVFGGDYQYVLTEYAGEGRGVCVRVDHSDAEKQVTGMIFGPLVLANG